MFDSRNESPDLRVSVTEDKHEEFNESELVGVYDVIGYVEWTSLYCKYQVKTYPIEHPLKMLGKKNLVKQDNISTIKMVKGGVRVCRVRTRNKK